MEKPPFSKVSATFSEFRGPLAEFDGPRTNRGDLLCKPVVGSRFLANHGAFAVSARSAVVRARAAQAQGRVWFGNVSAVGSRFTVDRARTAQTEK